MTYQSLHPNSSSCLASPCVIPKRTQVRRLGPLPVSAGEPLDLEVVGGDQPGEGVPHDGEHEGAIVAVGRLIARGGPTVQYRYIYSVKSIKMSWLGYFYWPTAVVCCVCRSSYCSH